MNKKDKKVRLFLWEPSGVNRSQWPITTGVPFPKGVLRSKKQICLWDGDKELPVTGRITAKWDDGSISWLLLDFQVDIAGNEKKELILQFGGKTESTAKPVCTLKAKKTEKGITVDNGNMKVIFRVGGRMPFDELLYKNKSILTVEAPFCAMAENGKKFFAGGDSVKIKVEDRNDFRSVIRCDGKFTADDGATCLDLITRVYIFAGKPFLKIYHTITNLEGRDIFLDDLSFRVPTRLNKVTAGYVTGQGLDDSIHPARDKKVSLSVKTVLIPETKYSAEALFPHVSCKDRLGEIDGMMERCADSKCVVRAGNGEEYNIAGEKLFHPITASGLICGEGIRVALACRNFYPQAPKKIAVNGNEIELALYWNFDNRPLCLWRGTAKTHEIHLVIGEGDQLSNREEILRYKRAITALEEPVAPTFGQSNWIQRTNVLGPILEYKPAKYPWLEFMFRQIFEGWFHNHNQALRGSTILDFGDYWNPGRGGQWQNNEMDFGAAMLMYMLRTGYPKPFRSIEAIIHHMIDVDTHHEAREPKWVGAQRYHQVCHGAFSPPTLCHQWLEGSLFYYLYTGYERAREIAIARADHFCAMIEAGHHRIKQLERVQGWPLIALSTMNEYFPHERYINACRAILDWLEEWLAEDGDLVYPYMWPLVEGEKGGSILGRGVIAQGLAHYHRLTGEKRAWNLLVEVMEKAKTTLFSPEGLGTKTSLLRRNYYAPGESDFIIEALGYLWEQTGDLEWMRLGLLNFKLALIQRDPIKGTHMGAGGGACEPYRFWPAFLYYADKSGILEDIKIY